MSIFDKLLNKRTITNPIFLKEFEDNNKQLQDLNDLLEKVSSDKKTLINRDIFFIKQEIYGEKNVYNELKNSFIPMLAIHDIRLEFNDYVAQYDFILITAKCIFVLKTKQLNGDIEITEDGDFIRIIKNKEGKFLRKQGMYNPISANEREARILEEILHREKLLSNMKVKPIVVISNPKAIINKSKCPENIKNNLYKYDQISTLIKKILDDNKYAKELSEKNMYEIANYLINNNKDENIDYISRYSLDKVDFNNENADKVNNLQNNNVEKDINLSEKDLELNQDNDDFMQSERSNSNEHSEVYELLRQYRWNKSKEEGFKPFTIFTNKELDSLIEAKPKNKEELLKVRGFGQKKVEMYGDAILEILSK